MDKPRRCQTCRKKDDCGTICKALTKMIGKKRECWDWTDDPDWEKKVQAEYNEYKARKEAES